MTTTFHISETICEELQHRGETLRDIAEHMGGDTNRNHLTLAVFCCVQKPSVKQDKDMLASLSNYFGTSPEFFLNLDNHWRNNFEHMEPFEMPDDVLDLEKHFVFYGTPEH